MIVPPTGVRVLVATKLFADETRFQGAARRKPATCGRSPATIDHGAAAIRRPSPTRGAEHAIQHLAGFNGVLQVDGYAAYEKLTDVKRVGGTLVLAHCWSHFRRRFYDLAKGGSAPIATEALLLVAALYDIEAQIRGRGAEERRAQREARSKPLIEDMERWLTAQLARVPSTIAEDIRYGLNHWQGLCRFLDDGRVEMDSNTP